MSGGHSCPPEEIRSAAEFAEYLVGRTFWSAIESMSGGIPAAPNRFESVRESLVEACTQTQMAASALAVVWRMDLPA
jgi:hypothetical protein